MGYSKFWSVHVCDTEERRRYTGSQRVFLRHLGRQSVVSRILGQMAASPIGNCHFGKVGVLTVINR